MKIIVLAICFLVNVNFLYGQYKYEIGIYVSVVNQSAFKVSDPVVNYTPSNMINPEFGLYFSKRTSNKINIVHQINAGEVWHGNKFNSSFGRGVVSSPEYFYLGYLPRINISLYKKKINFQAGIGLKYLFQNLGFSYSNQILNGITVNEILIAKGDYDNPVDGKLRVQLNSEIGIVFNKEFKNKRVNIKLNPFYQPHLTPGYRGLYKATVGNNITYGTITNNVHQGGLRLLMGFNF